MKCEHTDCMTCPYPDCISTNNGPANQPKKKPGRKKLPPLEKKQRKQRYQHDYYEKHKKEKAKSPSQNVVIGSFSGDGPVIIPL